MTEHKYTDEEVIKALECCTKAVSWGDCEDLGCPCLCKQGCYFYLRTDNDYENTIYIELLKEALDLINRQKAEVAFWMDAAANAKKEAVKEFAEKLKKECLFDRGYEIFQDGTIDHLVKEFTEEKT